MWSERRISEFRISKMEQLQLMTGLVVAMGAAAKVKLRWKLLEKEVSGAVKLKHWTGSSGACGCNSWRKKITPLPKHMALT